jgi:hypothetical protein
MGQAEAIVKAREFADRAHAVEIQNISRQCQDKLAASRAQLAARGILMSGNTVVETAKINGERITLMLQSRLDLLLEGFELHHVALDDQLTDRVVRELTALRSAWIKSAAEAFRRDLALSRLVSPASYTQMLEQNVELYPNQIRTQMDRRRLMPKKTEGTTTIIYHVSGHNNRWITNSQDHSVNVVTQSGDQIFASLRREIECKVPGGEEQRDILDRLEALEGAQNSPSFPHRYAEFIAAAANHMAIIGPFIPALTELFQRMLS